MTDAVGFLTPQTQDELNADLRQYQQATGHQVIVYIGDTTGGDQLEDWTIRAFEQWKVGRKGLDDGAILFVFASDHTIRIEVGYGLEDVLTDARSSEIIRNDMTPRLRAGDRDGAVRAGVADMLAAIGGPSVLPTPQPSEGGDNSDRIELGLLLVFVVVVPLVLSLMRRSVMYNIPGSRSSPWISYGGFGGFGGGGGGGFGGFSGGGGMGGGGGASGGW